MTRAHIIRAIAIAAAVAAAAPIGTRAAASAVTLAVAGRTNATPSIAAVHQFVAVAWGATLDGGGTDVYAAVSHDGGRRFGPPVRVNDTPGAASLGLEQPPRVSVVARDGRNPSIAIVWTAKAKEGTRLLVARSDDGGVSFTHAAPVAASEAPGNRGWESTAVALDGRVMVLWLDHRDMAAHQHDPHADGAAHAQASKLYFGAADAAGARAITAGVCYCCKTALATGPDGSIYAAWRHVYPGNIRDIAFAASRDDGRSFSAPVRVSDDHWMIEGCPENGPALAVGADNAVHVVWPTLVPGSTQGAEPTLALFHAVTRDGRTFSARERVATDGTPRHPQLLATTRTLVAAWDEEMPGGNRRVVIEPGAPHGRREVVSTARAQTPSLADAGDGIVIAWTEGAAASVIRVDRR